MINKLQQIMIFALYALFSVFCSVGIVMTSESMYVGIGAFFIILIGSLLIHLFFIGRTLYKNITKILFDVEDGNNFYQTELKNVREVIDGITNLMDTVITDQEKFEQSFQESQKNYQETITQFNKKISEQEKEQAHSFRHKKLVPNNSIHQLVDTPEISLEKEHHNQDIDYDHLTVRHISQAKDNKSFEKNDTDTFTSPSFAMKKPVSYLQEEEFSESSDNNFTNLNMPDFSQNKSQIPYRQQEQQPIQKSHARQSIKIDSFDDEFAVVAPSVLEKYDQLLNEDFISASSDSQDDFHSREIRKQLSDAPITQQPQVSDHHSMIIDKDHSYQDEILEGNIQESTHSATNFDDDDFVDVTDHVRTYHEHNHDQAQQAKNHSTEFNEEFDLPTSSEAVVPRQTNLQKTIDVEHNITIDSSSDQNNIYRVDQTASVPAFTELVPDEKLRAVTNRKSILLDKLSVPSLDKLLSNPTKKKSSHELLKQKPTKDLSPDFSEPEKFSSETAKNFIWTIRKALETNSIDLFIAPITDTLEREIRYFEANHFLRDEKEQYHPPEKFVPIARSEGMGVAVDRLMIVRSIQVLRHILHAIPSAGIFCNISILTITDTNFEQELLDILQERDTIPRKLIFQFPQEELGLLNSVRIQKIMYLRSLGVQFCLDKIYAALPNLDELSRIGISFLKIKPEDFERGLNCSGDLYNFKQIKIACQRADIKLCLTGIDDHAQLLLSVENSADLLQGGLLGEAERSDKLVYSMQDS